MGTSGRAEAGYKVKGQLWRMSLPWERSGQEAGRLGLLVPFPHSSDGGGEVRGHMKWDFAAGFLMVKLVQRPMLSGLLLSIRHSG